MYRSRLLNNRSRLLNNRSRLLTNGSRLYWLKVLLLVSSVILSPLANALVEGDTVELRQTYSGLIDYVANGASFRNANNGSPCSFVSPMSSTISLDFPAGANIVEAYLYFAGSSNNTGTINGTTQNSMTLNGVALNQTAGFNELDFTEVNLNAQLGVTQVRFFGGRRDVSNIVTGPGSYTFEGLQVATNATNSTCLGAWAVVVIYENTADTQIRVINLFDGFTAFFQETFVLQPRNFVADSGAEGKMTHISFEGDANIAASEQFRFGSESTIPAVALFDGTFNTEFNQYNDTVTGPDVFDRGTEYGLDIDTYEIGSFLNPGDYQATTEYASGGDLVLLMSEVISVDNKPLADIEVLINEVGVFTEDTEDQAQYVISVVNNGDGQPSALTGFATGFIRVYYTLPSELDIDSVADIFAPGWDCATESNFVTNELICSYDLSTLTGGSLEKNGAPLDDITLTLDVNAGAAASSPIDSTVRLSLCDTNDGTCDSYAGKHTGSTQFDPVNYYTESDLNIFNIATGSSDNNNVDVATTPIIAAAVEPSDLTGSTKTVSAPSPLSPNDTLTYTISVTESGGDTGATNITVTDVIDTDSTGFSLASVTNGCGGTASYTFGVLEVTGFDLSANASCTIVLDVDVPLTSPPGTVFDNSANIVSTNGIGTTVTAPSRIVSGTATGSKILYFDQLNSTEIITRDAPSTNTSATLASGASITLDLSPVLAADLDINAGPISVSVWVEGTVTRSLVTDPDDLYSVTAALSYPGSESITGDMVEDVALTAVDGSNPLSDVAELFPFQLSTGAITDFTTGEALTLTLTNGSTDSIVVHSLLNGIDSNVVIDAATVINVDDVAFYSDVARTNEIVTGVDTIAAGDTIYIEATISDPFGAQDITAATLTLVDPNLANQLTNVAMTEVSSSGAEKVYVYQYDIPDAASIDTGIWVAQVTGFEGDEGTVTHTEADSFETVAPELTVTYTVDNTATGKDLTASAGDTLTYTITINNAGSSTPLSIVQAIPNLTQSLSNFTGLGPLGATNLSDASNINLSFNAPGGQTVITFDVVVSGGVQAGDLIDHTISVNSGTITDVAPSVLIDPFTFNTGNKPIYADAFTTVRRFDRTEPTSDTEVTIASQGGSQTFTLSPTLQSTLNLDGGDINASIWVRRDDTSFAGQRIIEATLGYTGAINGTIDTDTVTVQLADGVANAQYLPFTFNLASPLALPANTSLTLTITNDTTVAGETITVHTLLTGDSTTPEPTLISLNATDPLSITSIEYFTDSIDTVNPGTPITEITPSSTIWVRATVADPFGREDIPSATITITDPTPTPVVTNQGMTIPTAQPISGAERYFEFQYTLGATLGDWNTAITAIEGTEGLVSSTDSANINVNNNIPDLTGSFKSVVNVSSGDNANTNPGDTLRYTISLVNSGLGTATGVSLTDVIPTNTTFVSGTLTIDGAVQSDPAGNITLPGLTVPASSTVEVAFDVEIDGGTAVSTLISNVADITNPDGVVTDITVESEDLIITGAPAIGAKTLYIEDLDSGGSQFLTRLQPQAPNTTDLFRIENAGGSITFDLDVPLERDLLIDPANNANIDIDLRLNAANSNGNNRRIEVEFGYELGGTFTSLGSQSRVIALDTGVGNIETVEFDLPVAAPITVPTGSQFRLTVTNNQGSNRDVFLYSFDSGSNRSTVNFVPSPVINVDSIRFLDAPNTSANLITNPNPTSEVVIYAEIVISDPFGEADIQNFDSLTPNRSTITVTSPSGAVTEEA